MKLTNQENIRTMGEKGNYKYLGMMEVDTIKQVKRNEKIRKVSKKNEKAS